MPTTRRAALAAGALVLFVFGCTGAATPTASTRPATAPASPPPARTNTVIFPSAPPAAVIDGFPREAALEVTCTGDSLVVALCDWPGMPPGKYSAELSGTEELSLAPWNLKPTTGRADLPVKTGIKLAEAMTERTFAAVYLSTPTVGLTFPLDAKRDELSSLLNRCPYDAPLKP